MIGDDDGGGGGGGGAGLFVRPDELDLQVPGAALAGGEEGVLAGDRAEHDDPVDLDRHLAEGALRGMMDPVRFAGTRREMIGKKLRWMDGWMDG